MIAEVPMAQPDDERSPQATEAPQAQSAPETQTKSSRLLWWRKRKKPEDVAESRNNYPLF